MNEESKKKSRGPYGGFGGQVQAPGGAASPSATRSQQPETRKSAVDQSVTMPQPAAAQLSGRIPEPGDVSAGPGSAEVDTGGGGHGNISGAPGSASRHTD